MKLKQVVAFSVALGAAGLAVVLTSGYMESLRQSAKVTTAAPAQKTVPVVVAARKLTHGRLITRNDLKVTNWPQNLAPEGAFRSLTAIFGANQTRVALSHFAANEVITKGRISGPGQRPSMAYLLNKGMRAVSVRIDAVLGVGGFISPGDRVDLVLTERANEADPDSVGTARVLLKNIRVLAIDQQTEDPEFKPKIASTATLEVALDDARKIALAATVGSISLALRSSALEAQADVAPAKVKAVKPPPRNPSKTVVVIRSAKPTEYTVPILQAGMLQ